MRRPLKTHLIGYRGYDIGCWVDLNKSHGEPGSEWYDVSKEGRWIWTYNTLSEAFDAIDLHLDGN